jgi:hypothetical protein
MIYVFYSMKAMLMKVTFYEKYVYTKYVNDSNEIRCLKLERHVYDS